MIDTLHPLTTSPYPSPTTFLSSLLAASPSSTSLLATYHADVPLAATGEGTYAPHPLTLLRYIATTLLTPHALPHMLAAKAARERSVAGPVYGLQEEKEGVVGGEGRNERGGVVVEMEYRRRSGRGVREWFWVGTTATATATGKERGRDGVVLLEDHPAWRREEEKGTEGEGVEGVSFDLGLTEKQRRDREGVVLPYFDAQRGEGPGEGGRILYDMGVEDDFDEEEDEI